MDSVAFARWCHYLHSIFTTKFKFW